MDNSRQKLKRLPGNSSRLAVAILLSLGVPAFAHRLNEYLQAAIISLEKDHVDVFLRLIPGVAVAPDVIASIDLNSDGVFSESERRVYTAKVLNDLLLGIDGKHLELRLRSSNFPAPAEIKAGLGEIQMEFNATLPKREGDRKLVLENHHQGGISAYMVNCLAPRDRDMKVVAQSRNENQSFYQLNYQQTNVDSAGLTLRWRLFFGAGLSAVILLVAWRILQGRRLRA